MGEVCGASGHLSEQTRRALSYRASGISLIATKVADGVAACLTNSVTLVCPIQNLILVCLSSKFLNHTGLSKDQIVGLSILSTHHEYLADRLMAGPNLLEVEDQRRSDGNVDSAAVTVPAAVCSLEGTIEDTTLLHSSVLIVVRVVKVGQAVDSAALLSWRGHYEPLGWTQSEADRAIGLSRH
jgi:flavin reductase (DIM6/NTAB) family NADH-FMN oxidoreductase RutF